MADAVGLVRASARRQNKSRHCEEQNDEAIHADVEFDPAMDCRVGPLGLLAMTSDQTKQPFTER